MQYTTNYSLKKPQYADEADIEVINDNTDDVDSLIHQNRTMIAPAFDNTKAYVTGDPVEYLGALYVFTADKAAGAWDASKVEPTTAAEMGGGGGASALADLDDVEITNPSTGQALLFDDDDDLWKNQTLPDASVTKEATGNPIEIDDAAAAPLVKCVTQITGYQEGTGTPSPDNIRPIVAYTEGEIVESGRNLVDNRLQDLEQGSIDGFNGNETTSTTRVRTSVLTDFDYDEIVNNGYVLTIPTGYKIAFRPYDANGNYVFINSDYIGFITALPNAWKNHGIKKMRFVYAKENESNITPSEAATIKIQLERGDTPHEYEEYITPTTHTTTFPSAIYRGSEDCVGGSATGNIIVYTVSNDTGVQSLTALTNTTRVLIDMNTPQLKASAKANSISNYLPYIEDYNLDSPHFYLSDSNNRIVAFFPGVMTGDQWRAYIASNPLQIAYELATPTTSSVTPTNLPIKSLSGYTHIESSTGEMEIEYITKTYEPLVELIEASDHIYSTQEQVIGTWVNGETLYEKTLVLPSAVNLSAGTWANSGCQISGIGIIPQATVIRSDSYGPWTISVGYNTSTGDIQLFSSAAISLGTGSMIILQYTKASSNNRSLSKGGGEQEVKEETTEETKEEPKEETKEENENNETER